MSQTAELQMPGRVRLADQVLGVLLDAVLDGRLPVGSLLPPERELAAQLDVNRTSLRQAIARLEQMGLVEPRQGRGTVVLDPRRSADPSLMAHLVARDRKAMLTELFEVRAALATLIGSAAAERATVAQRRRLRQRLAEVSEAVDASGRQQAELAFFGELVAMTRNRALMAMQQWVEVSYGGAADVFVAGFEDAAAVHEGLGAIVDAVESRDGGRAAAATHRYAEASGQRMLAAASSSFRRATGATS